jgi:hypothetical protein
MESAATLGRLLVFTNIVSGRKTVTAAGTAEKLVASATPCKRVVVSPITANTTRVAVGGTATLAGDANMAGVIFPAGTSPSVVFDVDDASKLYVDAKTNGEGVSFVILK